MPIVISVVVYSEAYRIVESEIMNANSEIMKQADISIDNGLQDVRNIGAFVSLNQNLNYLLKMDDMDTVQKHYYLVYHTVIDLKSYNTMSSYIDDYFVYLRKLDCVLTTNGMFSAREFFDSYNQKGVLYRKYMSYETWMEMLNGQYTGDYLPLNAQKGTSGSGILPVIYLKSIPIYGSGQSTATFVIALNDQRFRDALGSIGQLEQSWGIIVDSNNDILFSTKPLQLPVPVQYKDMKDMSGILYNRDAGNNVAIAYTTSGVEKWKYVSIMPLRLFEDKVRYIRSLILYGILLSVILGGAIAYFFSKRNYSPINDLIKAIGRRVGFPSGREINEYRYIKDAVDNAFTMNEKLGERLKQQSSVLRSNFLIRLLKGRFEDEAFVASAAEPYSIRFDAESFAVLLFDIEDYGSFAVEGKSRITEDRVLFVQYAVSNIVEEIAGKQASGYMTEVDRMLACIVNFKDEDVESCRRCLLHVATEARQTTYDRMKIDLLVSASGIHKTVFGIPEAYQEALDAMEYKIASENVDIVFFDMIRTSKSRYYYPMDTEHQLINCIKTGDIDAAISIIDDVFNHNFSRESLSRDMIRCLMFDLSSTMLKTIPEIDDTYDNEFLQKLDIVGRLLNCKKAYDMKREMIAILSEICAYIQQNRKMKKKEHLIEDVVTFILGNYADANMSVYLIAEKFRLTPAYLTKLFREQTGGGVSDYLMKTRIERAKQLLKSGDTSIKELAARVGYYSSMGFIKAFKKMEGVTPGMYKDSELSEVKQRKA